MSTRPSCSAVSSAGIFSAIANMLVLIYKAAGYKQIVNWVDDFLVI
jgi:hypothetical protein